MLAALGVAPATAAPARPAALCDLLNLCDLTGGGSGDGTGDEGGGLVGGVVDGVGGLVDGLLGGSGSEADGGIPALPLVPENDSGTVFTRPAAQLSGSSLIISGLHSASLVTVPLIDGSRVTVIKLEADRIQIDDFVIDVRKTADGGAGVTTSDRMVLSGHVAAYVDSLSATLPGGLGLNLGAQTPLPGDELPSHLLTVSLGLVGIESDSMTMTPSHLAVSD
ncbi:MAG: hypothetical protein J0G30_03040 [Actinomycetales bacterium]|nr:hypothetical protein [Actinomycetales bacterium]